MIMYVYHQQDYRICYRSVINSVLVIYIKIVQIIHRSYKLILKNNKIVNIQYYTQYNTIATAIKYHAAKPIYQIGVETETNKYHE